MKAANTSANDAGGYVTRYCVYASDLQVKYDFGYTCITGFEIKLNYFTHLYVYRDQKAKNVILSSTVI
jgi:hypothetical protein